MNDNTSRPDRFQGELDDLDVPTYHKGSSSAAARRGGDGPSKAEDSVRNSAATTEQPAAKVKKTEVIARPKAGATPVTTSEESEQPTAAQEETDKEAEKKSASRKNIYERVGRAAPTVIQPAAPAKAKKKRKDSAEEVEAAAEEHNETETKVADVPKDNETVDIKRPAVGKTEKYRDEDFATRSGTAETAVAPAVGVAAGSTAVKSDDVLNTKGKTGDKAAGETAVDKKKAEEQPEHRRGTTDLGLLLGRLVLAAWLLVDSLGTFFEFGGHRGITGLENEFTGYAASTVLAFAVPTMELAAGVFIFVGLIMPLFTSIAAMATGFMFLHYVAASGTKLHVYRWPDSAWLTLILCGLAIALTFTGPGRYGADFARSWARRPRASAWVFAIIALVGIVLMWALGTQINPLG